MKVIIFSKNGNPAESRKGKFMKYVCAWTLSDGRRVENQLYTAEKIPDLLKNLEEWKATNIQIVSAHDSVTVKGIYQDIQKAVDDIFLTYQDRLDIEDGDSGIALTVQLDDNMEELANTIYDCLRYQQSGDEWDEE